MRFVTYLLIKSILFLLALFCTYLGNVPPAVSQFQLTQDSIFELGNVKLFSSEYYKDTITRQNSCTIYLADFLFAEPVDGKFLVNLAISFNSAIPGSIEPKIKREYRTVFSDVIENIKENEAVELSLSNKKLIENFNLSDVTDINIKIELIRKKEENTTQIMNLVKPLLGKVSYLAPFSEVLDNFLLDVQDPSKKQILLFQGDFRVPQNVFEYSKLKTTGSIPLIKNNEKCAILLEGETSIPKADASVSGNAFKFINDVTNYVSGKSVIKPDKFKYKGAVKLFFTKDAISLLPQSLNEELHDIERNVDKGLSTNINSVANEIELKLSEAYQLTEFNRKEKNIDEQTYFSIVEYLKISKIYLDYLKYLDGDSKNSENIGWDDRLKTWAYNIDIKGAMQQFQAIGIKNIYKNKIAKIYLPYSLGDNLIMSFFQMQVCLHQALLRNNDSQLARDYP